MVDVMWTLALGKIKSERPQDKNILGLLDLLGIN